MQQTPQQQQQQQQTALPPNISPLAAVTTEHIQKFLDENKQLILAILESQNLGKMAECLQYQNRLQQNLTYLAAIADAQPQAQLLNSQLAAQYPMMQSMDGQQATMPHPQVMAATPPQQQSMVQRFPMQFNITPQQLQENPQLLYHIQQQQMLYQQQHANMMQHGMRPTSNDGVQPDTSMAGTSRTPTMPGSKEFAANLTPRTTADDSANKQDGGNVVSSENISNDNTRNTMTGHSIGDTKQ